MSITQIAQLYNQQADMYDDIYSSIIAKAEDRVLYKLLKQEIKGKVLDIGCGTGQFLEYIRPEAYIGIDVSEKMIQKAREKYPHYEFYVADMHTMDFVKDSFDSIVSIYGPFSYSQKPRPLLKKLYTLLEPKGKLAIMPYTKRVKHNFYLGGCSTATISGVPKKYYTTKSIQRLFSNLPFNEVQILGINYFVNIINDLTIQFGKKESLQFYEKNLWHELEHVKLPIEYARHCLIMATAA